MSITRIPGGGMPHHDRAGEMAERIKEIIGEYAGQVPLATAVGVLEIVKTEIMVEND